MHCRIFCFKKSAVDITAYPWTSPPSSPYCHRGMKPYDLLTTNNGHSIKLKAN